MDFNDLNVKLKRLYIALGEQYDDDIGSNIIDTRSFSPDGKFEHITTFGSNDPAKNQNLVMNAIHLIGSLKDIIKHKLRDAGEDPQLYEQLINDNRSLALVTDLDNKDKHGDSLTSHQRFNKDSQIVNIKQGLRGRGITNVLLTTDFTTGKTRLDSVEGDVKIVVLADVVDSAGNLIMPLDKMLEEAVNLMESFLLAHNLL